MPRQKKINPYLIDRAKKIANNGAIQIPTMIKSQMHHFMDQDTYEQPAIPVEVVGEAANYLRENLNIKLTFYQNEPIDIELPITVDLNVVEAEVAVRGDTATGVNKKVTTETGLKVQVPNFIEAGDVIRVDTRTGTYITRV